MSEKAQAKTVKVKLLKAHQHAGMAYDTGMEIEVPEHDATWLKNLGIVDDGKVSTTATPKPVEDK